MLKNKTNNFILLALVLFSLNACAATPAGEYQSLSDATPAQTQKVTCDTGEHGTELCVGDYGRVDHNDSELGRVVSTVVLELVVHGVIELLAHALVHH